MQVLPSRDFATRGAIVRIAKTNAILELPMNKLFRFWSMMGEEHLNALSLVYIHRDICLDYDKIIDIYAPKYPRRMLLINPLRKN